MKKHLIRIFTYMFLILLSFQKSFSIDLNFKYYFVEDGLSSNTVYDILQDSHGFMWIATEGGLNRFDGYEFRSFRNIPRDTTSIMNNYVYCLFEDNEQKLWIGTEKGVDIYDLQTNSFYIFKEETEEGVVISDRIQNIFSDEQGQIWVSSYRQGVFCYNKQTEKLKKYYFDQYKDDQQEHIPVTCIYRDKENNIWASVNNTRYQIYKLDKQKDEFLPAFPDEDPDRLKKLTSYVILEDTFGTLWFGSWTNGLFEVDKKEGIKANYLNTENVDKILHIHSMNEYEPGSLLIGSNDGLTSFSISPTRGSKLDAHIREPILSNRFVYPIYKDREGGLWIGTYYGGINYASPNRNYFTSYAHDRYENSISGNVISTFCEDKDGNLWIGTDDGGLNFFNTRTEHFTPYKPDKNKNSISFHNIHALCIDNNDLWIGTYTGGLNVMDMKIKEFKHYYTSATDTTSVESNSVYSLYKDTQNNIWIGTMGGINLYNRDKDNFSRVRKMDELTMDILQVGNVIYFATIGDGLHTYNLDTREWKQYKFDSDNPLSIISNDVNCLCLDEQNRIWIGTISGLCIFNPENENFIEEQVGFPSNTICNIFSENGSLWITTTKGLVNYVPATKHYRIFTKGDGLLSDQFTPKSGIKTSSGRIYVGTANGFNAFYPKQIVINRNVPQLAITDFQLFNKSVRMDDYVEYDKGGSRQVVLPHNKNAFSFEYTALSFFAPEKNEYAFMLVGFDKKWNYVGKERKATYTNIPPGEYYFRIKASNNDGIWNETGLTVKVIITPPIWWNNWSITLYLLLIIVALIALALYLQRLNAKRNNERIEKIRNEQEKEAYTSKINFFTTIAHEIRTPVSLIIGPLEQIINSAASFPEKITDDLKIIERNSQRLLSLVNQLLDFRKIEKETVQINLTNQNIYLFLQNMYYRFKTYVENKNIHFVYTYDTENLITGIDTENLTKVVSNILNNASKYTKDYIELSLHTNTRESMFEIRVTDNGAGIPEKEKENIFKPFYQIQNEKRAGTGLGLHLVKSIVEACNGEIVLQKGKEDKGLAFSVFLPLVQAHPVEENADVVSYEEVEKSPIVKEPDKFLNEEQQVILVVEDNPDMQNFIQKNLSEVYTVLVADDGVKGIKLLEKNVVDIIITDIMMPNMDGIEFCNMVKKNFLWNHIPVVMLTAKTTLASKMEALEIGADAYVEKPFSISYLMLQIKNLLQSRKNLLKKFTETPFASLKSIAGNKADEEFLAKVNDIIEKNISNVDFTIEQLAEDLSVSSSGLFAKIKNLSGVTPNKLLLTVRLKKAAELLSENKYRVNEVCYMVGFNNPSYFAKCFQKQYNVLPKDFMEKNSKPNHAENIDTEGKE